jgi:hypothetical protein
MGVDKTRVEQRRVEERRVSRVRRPESSNSANKRIKGLSVCCHSQIFSTAGRASPEVRNFSFLPFFFPRNLTDLSNGRECSQR